MPKHHNHFFVGVLQIDNMRLVYNSTTRTTTNSPGVKIRLPGFGNTDTVEWLDPSHRYPTGYFYDIVQAMVTSDLAYKRGTTVRGAPFDFRKAPSNTRHPFICYPYPLLCLYPMSVA